MANGKNLFKPLRVVLQVGKAIDHTARSGLALPRRFMKGKPAARPGIEYEELKKLPSSPEPVRITCIDYRPDQVQVLEVKDLAEFVAKHRPEWSAVRWINVDGIANMEVIHALATKYDIHPLAVEDMLHVPQRPKVDAYGGDESDHQARLFIVGRMLQLRNERLHSEQISICLGHKTVLTFQESPGDVWDPIRVRINTKGSRLRQNDASFLSYCLIDAMVDHCFPILEHYGDRLHELEEDALDRPDVTTIQEIHAFNRELMLLRRAIWPMRELVLALHREPHECLSENARVYLKDVYDHSVQIIDIIETYRELAASLTETYATLMGNKLNEVVKVLTIMSAVFTPPTFLASVWGMNFANMPEIRSSWAEPWVYPIGFWVLSIGSSAGMLLWFKSRRWL
jgi:magnesium transporter